MSKAEELSQNRYPTLAEKYAFIDGYEQAEKDMELTWEDLQLICKIEFSICYYEYKGKKLPPQEQVYKEILKRFKDCKGRKEK